MSETLSQSEIDALVSVCQATGSPDVRDARQAKEIRLYDFARPDRFCKEHLKSLSIIHEKHGSAFAAAVALKLHTHILVNRLPVDQLAYREYCASVPEGTLFVEARLDPLTATAIFEFNAPLVCACVDLLAGGKAPSATATDITDIDKSIMRPIVDLALRKYTEAWSTCMAFRPEIISMSTDPNSRQVLLPGEGVIVCAYEVNIGAVTNMMSICIPASAIEAVLPALTVGRTLNVPAHRHNNQASQALRKAFDNVPMSCHAVLGSTHLPLQDVVDLQIGDVIGLPVRSSGLAELWIENSPTFGGVLGLSGSNLAVKIVRKLENPGVD